MSQVVKKLNAAGHEAVPHSLSTGVDVITGQGVEEAVAGADGIVNLMCAPGQPILTLVDDAVRDAMGRSRSGPPPVMDRPRR